MNVFRALAACAVCLMSLAHPAPLAAQAPGEPAEGNVSIYNLDSQSRTAGLAIDGSIDKAVASRALEIGQEIKRLSILTAMDEHAECLGACVLILAAGARRSPMPDKVGLYRLAEKNPALAKRVQSYLTRMGMPDRLFQEMMQRSPDKMLVLDATRLKTLRLEGIDPAYEKWLRENTDQQPTPWNQPDRPNRGG